MDQSRPERAACYGPAQMKDFHETSLGGL